MPLFLFIILTWEKKSPILHLFCFHVNWFDLNLILVFKFMTTDLRGLFNIMTFSWQFYIIYSFLKPLMYSTPFSLLHSYSQLMTLFNKITLLKLPITSILLTSKVNYQSSSYLTCQYIYIVETFFTWIPGHLHASFSILLVISSQCLLVIF